jgi:hypothetical protein
MLCNNLEHLTDDSLYDWNQLSQARDWKCILLGNGASCAVWEDFRYRSLYEKAFNSIENKLGDEEKQIFKKFSTENFELILSALNSTKIIGLILNLSSRDINKVKDTYNRIQNALAEAVKSSHIPWTVFPPEKQILIRNELRRYRFVYSTNYDLIAYWSIMQNREDFIDYFFGDLFNQYDVEKRREEDTSILYLHGGLHLYIDVFGRTIKRKAQQGQNLLDLFGTDFNGAFPLIVSEGTSQDKLNAIRRSDYLSFAYEQFKKHSGPLVIFGAALNENYDHHLIDAIKMQENYHPQYYSQKTREKKELAISLRNQKPDLLISRKAYYLKLFPEYELYFYDASTHPLGSPAIRVTRED